MFFLPSLRGGGAERVMVTVANVLASKGFDVDLVVCQLEGPYLNNVSPQVNVVSLQVGRVVLGLPKLIRYLIITRPLVVLSTLVHANVTMSLAHMVSLSSSTLVLRDANVVHAGNSSSVSMYIVNLASRFFYRRADKIIAVSQAVKDSLVKYRKVLIEDINIAYNPVVDDELKTQSYLLPEHSWWSNEANLTNGCVKRAPIILAAGRLAYAKGFDVLIEAFAKLNIDNARLVILGEGHCLKDLLALSDRLGVGARVSLPGFEKNPFSFMRHSDLFVLSSRWEGLPNTLIQAMACGTPVISTDCPGGSREILEGGKWGRLVPVDDSEALALAMHQSLEAEDHPDVTRRAQDFSVDAAVERYMEIMGLPCPT
ncbi:glycosyltransferase [Halomonas sp. MCCC 1A11062]|nr:glycosyltransferase [Halomonas sp. MCCC 1A11062]